MGIVEMHAVHVRRGAHQRGRRLAEAEADRVTGRCDACALGSKLEEPELIVVRLLDDRDHLVQLSFLACLTRLVSESDYQLREPLHFDA